MSGLLLRVSAAPPGKKPLSTIGSKPPCLYTSVWEHKGWNSLTVHASVFESLNLSNICNRIVTTALPYSEGLDDCSHSFIMSSYILFAHVWVHAARAPKGAPKGAPKDVALRVIPSAERAACVPGYWLPRHVWHMRVEGYSIFLFQI